MLHETRWLDTWTYSYSNQHKHRQGNVIHTWMCTHWAYVVCGADKALSLFFSLASIMAPACCQRACIAWGEVPICGSMWQGGSKSPLMNQYVGRLSLWRGRPRSATRHSAQMYAYVVTRPCLCHLNLIWTCRIRDRRFGFMLKSQLLKWGQGGKAKNTKNKESYL